MAGSIRGHSVAPWAAGGVLVVTFLVFSGSLGHGFVNWDDPCYVVDNPAIKGLDWPHLKQIFRTFQFGFYAPLSQVSLALDYALWGLNPSGYHLSSMLLHALNAVLVFLLTRQLVLLTSREGPLLSERASVFAATVAALLFGIHPLRVESVAWVSERRDTLSGLLVLACVLTYVTHAGQPSGKASCRWWLALCFALFVLAILAKPTAVMLTMILILLDVYPLRRIDVFHPRTRWNETREALGEKLPFLLASLLVGWGTIYGVACGYLGNRAYDLQELSWSARIAQSLAANLHYLNKLVIPVQLSPLYALSRYDFSQPIVALAAVVTVGITTAGVAGFVRWPAFLIAWLAYLAWIGPFLGMTASGPQFAADRYTYLASIGLSVVLGVWLAQWGDRHGWRKVIPAIALVLLTLAGLTVRQTRVWRDSETLWRSAIREDSRNAGAWIGLLDALDQAGKREIALQYASIMTRHLPRSSEGWFQLGCLLGSERRYSEALEAYRRCLELSPQFDRAYQNTAWVYLQMGQWTKALQFFRTAQDLRPKPETLLGLALCYEKLGNRPMAVRYYEMAVATGFGEVRRELNRRTSPDSP